MLLLPKGPSRGNLVNKPVKLQVINDKVRVEDLRHEFEADLYFGAPDGVRISADVAGLSNAPFYHKGKVQVFTKDIVQPASGWHWHRALLTFHNDDAQSEGLRPLLRTVATMFMTFML